MPIGKALLLKGLGGLAAIGGTIGGGCYIYNRYYSNQETRFDEGLIDYLEAGGKIQFSVKNGSSTEITNDFPQFTSGTPTLTATIKVSVSTDTGGTTDGTLTDATSTTPIPEKGKKETLQKLNGNGTDAGTAWTWECKIVFEKSGTATELKDKEKLVKESSEKGFFDKLKDTDTTNKHKDLKIKFIKDCAAARGKDKNKDINKKESLDSNKIESTKTFKLIDNSETTKKLIPEDQSDFNYWFGITSN